MKVKLINSLIQEPLIVSNDFAVTTGVHLNSMDLHVCHGAAVILYHGTAQWCPNSVTVDWVKGFTGIPPGVYIKIPLDSRVACVRNPQMP